MKFHLMLNRYLLDTKPQFVWWRPDNDGGGAFACRLHSANANVKVVELGDGKKRLDAEPELVYIPLFSVTRGPGQLILEFPFWRDDFTFAMILMPRYPFFWCGVSRQFIEKVSR